MAMNPIIINAVDCSVCGAKAGNECTSTYGCGMRIDEFAARGSFKDRLAVHLETVRELKDKFPDMNTNECDVFLTMEELKSIENKLCDRCGGVHYRSGNSYRWCPKTYEELKGSKITD
jgi:hypothetical protein